MQLKSVKGSRLSWDIRDKDLPKNPSLFSDFDLWPDGHIQKVYDTRQSPEALKHVTGWAMRNTNNHNIYVLKKSCLGVLVCTRACWKNFFPPPPHSFNPSSPSSSSSPSSILSNSQAVSQDSPQFSPHHPSPNPPPYMDSPVLDVVQNYECYRPAICDKARGKQLEKPCPRCGGKLELKPCGGQCGFPVTHFWRSEGHIIYFQGKGKHDHPKPMKFHSSSERKRKRKDQTSFVDKKVKRFKSCNETKESRSPSTCTTSSSSSSSFNSSSVSGIVTPTNCFLPSSYGIQYDNNVSQQHKDHLHQDFKKHQFFNYDLNSAASNDTIHGFVENHHQDFRLLFNDHSSTFPYHYDQYHHHGNNSFDYRASYPDYIHNDCNSGCNSYSNDCSFTDDDYKDAMEVLVKNLSENEATTFQRREDWSINSERDLNHASPGCQSYFREQSTFDLSSGFDSTQFSELQWRSSLPVTQPSPQGHFDNFHQIQDGPKVYYRCDDSHLSNFDVSRGFINSYGQHGNGIY